MLSIYILFWNSMANEKVWIYIVSMLQIGVAYFEHSQELIISKIYEYGWVRK